MQIDLETGHRTDTGHWVHIGLVTGHWVQIDLDTGHRTDTGHWVQGRLVQNHPDHQTGIGRNYQKSNLTDSRYSTLDIGHWTGHWVQKRSVTESARLLVKTATSPMGK